MELKLSSLIQEERDLSDRLHTIIISWSQLRFIAEKYNLQRVLWQTEDADKDDAIRSLLDFEIDGVPFLSEAYLYDAVGKEDARTILALMRKVIRLIDPAQQYDL